MLKGLLSEVADANPNSPWRMGTTDSLDTTGATQSGRALRDVFARVQQELERLPQDVADDDENVVGATTQDLKGLSANLLSKRQAYGGNFFSRLLVRFRHWRMQRALTRALRVAPTSLPADKELLIRKGGGLHGATKSLATNAAQQQRERLSGAIVEALSVKARAKAHPDQNNVAVKAAKNLANRALASALKEWLTAYGTASSDDERTAFFTSFRLAVGRANLSYQYVELLASTGNPKVQARGAQLLKVVGTPPTLSSISLIPDSTGRAVTEDLTGLLGAAKALHTELRGAYQIKRNQKLADAFSEEEGRNAEAKKWLDEYENSGLSASEQRAFMQEFVDEYGTGVFERLRAYPWGKKNDASRFADLVLEAYSKTPRIAPVQSSSSSLIQTSSSSTAESPNDKRNRKLAEALDWRQSARASKKPTANQALITEIDKWTSFCSNLGSKAAQKQLIRALWEELGEHGIKEEQDLVTLVMETSNSSLQKQGRELLIALDIQYFEVSSGPSSELIQLWSERNADLMEAAKAKDASRLEVAAGTWLQGYNRRSDRPDTQEHIREALRLAVKADGGITNKKLRAQLSKGSAQSQARALYGLLHEYKEK